MRYQITITGILDSSWAGEEDVHRDAPGFLRRVEDVHSDIVPGSVSLVSVERLPDPAPSVQTDNLADAMRDLNEFELARVMSIVTALQASRQA